MAQLELWMYLVIAIGGAVFIAIVIGCMVHSNKKKKKRKKEAAKKARRLKKEKEATKAAESGKKEKKHDSLVEFQPKQSSVSQSLALKSPDNSEQWETMDIDYKPPIDSRHSSHNIPSSTQNIRGEIDLGDPQALPYLDRPRTPTSPTNSVNQQDLAKMRREISVEMHTYDINNQPRDRALNHPGVRVLPRELYNYSDFRRTGSVITSPQPQPTSHIKRYSSYKPYENNPPQRSEYFRSSVRPISPLVMDDVQPKFHSDYEKIGTDSMRETITSAPTTDYIIEKVDIAIPKPDYQARKKPPDVPPKPISYVKKRDFRGPYGPEQLDEMNNPLTLSRGKVNRAYLDYRE